MRLLLLFYLTSVSLWFYEILNFLNDWTKRELLALGERIGSVSTGFDEDLISKCLTETVYRSSGQSEDEGTCVICLVRIFSKYILSVRF